MTAGAQGSYADAQSGGVSVAALGRGDTGGALSSWETALFYNPAQFGRLPEPSFFSLLGGAVGGNGRTLDAIEFYEDELDRVDDLSDAELRRVSNQARDRFGRPAPLYSTLYLPAFGFRAGTVGVGATAVVNQTARIQSIDTGGEFPTASVFGQVDGVVMVGAGAPLRATGVSVGVTGRYVRRHVTAYAAPIDAFDTPPVLRGTRVALDLGALYQTPVPGLAAGVTVYNAVGGRMDYRQDDVYGLVEEEPLARDVAAATEILEDRNGASVRLGTAYDIPHTYLRGVRQATILADWLSASSTGERQSVLRKLRLGAETAVGPFRLRGGLGQGYPSVGAGVNLYVVQLDYALYGRQEGLLPENGVHYTHMIQVRIGER
jgi:hypothetical protein